MKAFLIVVIFFAGCSNVSDVRIKGELGFGEIIGKWLPRLSIEFEFTQTNDVATEDQRKEYEK